MGHLRHPEARRCCAPPRAADPSWLGGGQQRAIQSRKHKPNQLVQPGEEVEEEKGQEEEQERRTRRKKREQEEQGFSKPASLLPSLSAPWRRKPVSSSCSLNRPPPSLIQEV